MTIKTLTLTNFRQFTSKQLEFKKPWTIIIGPNAHGKSTIVEALYLLSHGESPWEHEYKNIVRFLDPAAASPKSSKRPEYQTITDGTGRLEATVASAGATRTIAMFIKANGGTTAKQYFVDDAPKTRLSFLALSHSVLFSPDLIDVLMFEPAQRRNFLDTYASALYPDFDGISTSYHKVLRQRNILLRQRNHNYQNNPEMDGKNVMVYWTQQLVELGSHIIQTRLDFIERLNESSDRYDTSITYKPHLPIHELGNLADRIYLKELFAKRLSETAEHELLAGKTLVGPHRDDWFLSQQKRNLNTFGSRGEKRMAIADIIFKLNLLLFSVILDTPVLLLDDVASELDEKNIKLLFMKKIPADQQVIITTTHKSSIPADVLRKANVILV